MIKNGLYWPILILLVIGLCFLANPLIKHGHYSPFIALIPAGMAIMLHFVNEKYKNLAHLSGMALLIVIVLIFRYYH